MTELQCTAITRDLNVSSAAVSEPSSGPLGISLATRDAIRVLRWLLAVNWARQTTSVSFLFRGPSAGSEVFLVLPLASLLTVAVLRQGSQLALSSRAFQVSQ